MRSSLALLAGVVRDNWPPPPLVVSLRAAGVLCYVWRRMRARRGAGGAGVLCATCVLLCVRRVGVWPVGLVLFVYELCAAAYDVCSVVCVRRVRRSLRTGD